MTKLPEDIADSIRRRSRHESAPSPCESCNAHCCSGPGFALLENVIEVFVLYQAGRLVREGYQFEKGLAICDFIWRYFDRVVHDNRLLTFFPKTFSDDYGIVSVPPWGYYRARARIQEQTGKRGCVFLSRMLEARGTRKNSCILHAGSVQERITAKPIDCVFQNCSSDRRILRPSDEESAQWVSLLDRHFPHSRERFFELCPGMPDQVAGVWRSDAPG